MNEELIKRIEELTDELKEINCKYQAVIADKTKEFQSIIDDGNTKAGELTETIKTLRLTTNELNSLIAQTKDDSSKNSQLIEDLRRKVENVDLTLSDLEKRFVILNESLKEYEKVKTTIDSFNKRQSAIEVELMSFQKKLESQNEDFENIQKSLGSLKGSDLYKLFIEENSTLKDIIIDEVIDAIINKVHVKNAAFKSKLELERKEENNKQ